MEPRALPADEAVGVRLLRRALEEPLRQIAATGAYEDLALAGVIDPTKVTCYALQHAASGAGLLLTTSARHHRPPEEGGSGMGMGY